MPNGDIRTDARYVERDTERTIRHRNKGYYRVLHWPIWIFVFFIVPGPLTFDLFERGFDRRTFAWLAVVLCATAVAALRGRLPGCEPKPYIIRFTEDRPNPLYRRVCYTTAWGEVVAFAVPQYRRPGLCGGDRGVASEADVRRRVFSDRRQYMDARRAGIPSPRQGVDTGRGPRAAVLLWVSVGCDDRAARAVGDVGGTAGDPRGRPGETGHISQYPHVRRPLVAPRTLATHSARLYPENWRFLINSRHLCTAIVAVSASIDVGREYRDVLAS